MQKYRVTGPDGSTYVITAPDDAAAAEATQQFFGGASQAPAAAAAPAPAAPAAPTTPTPPFGDRNAVQPPPAVASPPRSWMDAITSGMTQGLVGINEGAANLLGLPVDIVNNAPRAANLLPGVSGVGPISERPFGGSDQLRDLFMAPFTASRMVRGMPTDVPEPQGVVERGVRRVGQEFGAATVPVAGVMGTAARMTPEMARNAPAVARFLGLEKATVNPGRYLGDEALMAGAAGTGAAVGRETANQAGYAPDSNAAAISDFLGAIFGVGGMAAGRSVVGPTSNVVGAMTGNTRFADGVVRDTVVDTIANAAGVPARGGVMNTDDLVAAIRRGDRIGDNIPGFIESTADRTQNPGLAALEYSRQSGPNSGMFAGRRSQNAGAVDTAIAANAPQGNPGALRGALEAERDNRLAEVSGNRAAAEADAEAATRPLAVPPGSTPATRGNTIRTDIENAAASADARTRAAYEAANTGENQVDPTNLTAALDQVTQSLPAANRDLVPRAIIDEVAALGRTEGDAAAAPVALDQANALKTRLLAEQRKAQAAERRDGTGPVQSGVLGRYIDAVEGFIQRNVSPDQASALDTARTLRREQADNFTRPGTPLADATATRPGGEYRMRDERVASTFVDPQNMQRLLAQADTPATRRAIQEEVLSKADASSPEGLRRFMDEYGQQIDRFPGLRQTVERAYETRAAETMARGAEGDLTRELGEKGRSVVARYLQYGDENAERAMRMVMANKDPSRAADELLRFVGDDKAAVEGARKTFWQVMEADTRTGPRTIQGDRTWNARALEAFLGDPAKRAVADRLYRDNPDHLKNLTQIAEVLKGVDVRNAARAPNTSGTAQALQGNVPVETIQSSLFAVERGVVGPVYAATRILGVWARRATSKQQVDAFNKALDRALLDPEWAARLLEQNNPANRAALARGARAWLGNQTSTLLDMLDDNPDSETNRAIMEK